MSEQPREALERIIRKHLEVAIQSNVDGWSMSKALGGIERAISVEWAALTPQRDAGEGWHVYCENWIGDATGEWVAQARTPEIAERIVKAMQPPPRDAAEGVEGMSGYMQRVVKLAQRLRGEQHVTVRADELLAALRARPAGVE